MKRKDALGTIMNSVSNNDAIISSTGLISRELYENHDSAQIFYMVGSMGLASSIGLGLAMCKPDRRVVTIDGDGSLLMNLCSLPTIGHFAPNNLTHIVLDNGAYASCNEEPSISKNTRLDEMAKIAGYSNVYKVDDEKGLRKAIQDSYRQGPSFILAYIELGGRRDLKRPLDLVYIKKRFQDFLNSPKRQ